MGAVGGLTAGPGAGVSPLKPLPHACWPGSQVFSSCEPTPCLAVSQALRNQKSWGPVRPSRGEVLGLASINTPVVFACR